MLYQNYLADYKRGRAFATANNRLPVLFLFLTPPSLVVWRFKMKRIQLTQGKTVMVDDQDYDWLNQRKWCVLRVRYTNYAVHSIRLTKTKTRQERMHRLILGLQDGDNRECDHIDGDGLNNQRANLRNCTKTQNSQSQRKRIVGISRYKGVCWNRRNRRWNSYIRVNRKSIHLGYFDSETDAARAYDVAALRHFGWFALTNKMMGLI